MKIIKYLDPKTDIVFKKMFGTRKNREILIHFLNGALNKGKDNKIEEIEFLDPTLQPAIAAYKQSSIDVLCTDHNGAQYIVEMQVAPGLGFEKRAQYYAARVYCSQMKKGGEYQHLKEVIFLAITDFIMFPNKPGYKSAHILLDKKSHEHDLKDFSFTFIELPKFKKELHELETDEDKWYYFFKHASEPTDMKKLLKDSDVILKKAYNVLSTHSWTEQELQAYEREEMAQMDRKARDGYQMQQMQKLTEQAKLEGQATGEAKGLEKGREEGREEGLKQGREVGRTEGMKIIAKNMLDQNYDIHTISAVTTHNYRRN